MKKITILSFFLMGSFIFHPLAKSNSDQPQQHLADMALPKITGESYLQSIYQQFPENSFSWEVFKYAMTGKKILERDGQVKKTNLLTLIDFSKPSTEERFFVLDLDNYIILFSSLTSHGQQTGDNWAKNFSNIPESHQSSLGFFKTAETYYGSKGFSMRLDGLETGINHHARARAIVIHAADYVSNSFIQKHGRLGRSYGCPALPNDLNRPIIEKIKEGSLLFIYAPDKQYQHQSEVFKSSDTELYSVEANNSPSHSG